MDPVSDQAFSHDYIKFVYQDSARFINRAPPVKPFEINPPKKTEKPKKDLEKRKETSEDDRA